MKASFVLAALAASFAGMASAQDLSSIPACVLTCSTQAATTAGCSGVTDTACICSSAAFVSAAQTCLVASCTAAEQQAALVLQSALCGAVVPSGSVTSAIASSIASAAATESTDVASLTSALSTAGSAGVSSAIASATSAVASSAASASSRASSAASSAVGVSSSAASSAGGVVASAASKASSAASSAAAAATSAVAKSGASSVYDSASIKVAGLVGLAVMGGMMVMA